MEINKLNIMKKIILSTLFFVLFCNVLIAQVSKGFNYQAVIRDSSGELYTDQSLVMELSILGGVSGETVLYTETHAIETDSYGRVNLTVGGGDIQYGDFSQIKWGEYDKYLRIEADLGSGNINMGTIQLLSVPFAMFANSSNEAASLGTNSVYSTDSDTLFVVKDRSGNVVFAVFPDGAQVYVNETAKGKVGGFAVSGRSPSKADVDIFRITPDSTRIYVNDTVAAKGKVGGFAVSGRSPSKGVSENILYVTADSTRVYVNDAAANKGKVGGFAVSGRSPSKGVSENILYVTADSTRVYVNDALYSKGKVGGFAVSGRSPSKAASYDYLQVTRDSTRVYIADPITKGKVGGFAVSGRSPSKGIAEHMFFTTTDSTRVFTNDTVGGFAVQDKSQGSNSSYMKLTPLNYFIGHESGELVKQNPSFPDRGKYNTFFGYRAGKKNTYGYNNIFMGYQAGYSNDDGNDNIFLGISAGYYNVNSSDNIFIGNYAGYNTEADDPTFGSENVFIGSSAGYSNLEGYDNVYIGARSGEDNLNGRGNVFIGGFAGNSNLSRDNTIIGGAALYKNTSGQNNTVIGAYAGTNNITGDRNVFIGYQAGYDETGSDKLYIDNSNTATPLIYGDFTNGSEYVDINGNLNANGTYFHIATNPGSAAIPSNYAYQGAVNSTFQQYAFTIYDALWVTSSVFFDGVYEDEISGTYRDLYIKDDGQIGYVSSSKRYKKDIHDMEDISWLYKLRPVNFVYKQDETNTKEYGLIAEEVEKVNKLLVSYNKTGAVETVSYSKLITPILKAMQDQNKIITNQQKEIELLKKQNEEINKKLLGILKMINK